MFLPSVSTFGQKTWTEGFSFVYLLSATLTVLCGGNDGWLSLTSTTLIRTVAVPVSWGIPSSVAITVSLYVFRISASKAIFVFMTLEVGGSIMNALSWLPSTMWYETREPEFESASVANNCKSKRNIRLVTGSSVNKPSKTRPIMQAWIGPVYCKDTEDRLLPTQDFLHESSGNQNHKVYRHICSCIKRLTENEWDCLPYEVYNDCTVKRSAAVERTSM